MGTISITDMLISGRKDLAWYESNLDTLKDKYNNKFIAFHNSQVLESGSNVDNLMKKLKGKGIDTSNIFVRFISKVKIIL